MIFKSFGHSVWYKIKCWVWYRYTTIKPRYLGHTYCDSVDLMPHLMFELLSRFIEEEADNVVWYHEYATLIDGKNIRDEMQELYDWWNIVYIKEYDEIEDIIFNELDGCDDKIINRCLLTALNKLEMIRENDLEIKMIRIVKITKYLLT